MTALGLVLGEGNGGGVSPPPPPSFADLVFYYGQTSDATPTQVEIEALTTETINSAESFSFDIAPLNEGSFIALLMPNTNTLVELLDASLPGTSISSLEGYTRVENYITINSVSLDLYYDGAIGSLADGATLSLRAMFTRTT